MPISNIPLQPRNPNGKLFVLVIGRISTAGQREENIEASYRYVENYLSQIYKGEMEVRFLGEQASGMRTDRATIREAEDLIDAGIPDLIIAEDLSRIFRNPRHQYSFVQDAVDQSIRVICIGDNLDTAEENWEVNMGTAALRHGLHIPDTSRRVRRTATDSFHRGGMVMHIPFGYRKLTRREAATGEFARPGLRIAKLPESTSVIREMRRRLLELKDENVLADWLNDQGIAPGPDVKRGHWTGRLIKEFFCSPILRGQRTFRNRIYRYIFRTGKHRREPNPQPELAEEPSLAHLTPEEHQELLDAMGWTLRLGGSKPKRPGHRRGIPRKQTLWPGQAATCSICGATMHMFGKYLKCPGSQLKNGKPCWNHVQVDVQITRDKLIAWLLEQFDRNPECRNAFVEAAWNEIQRSQSHSSKTKEILDREVRAIESQIERLLNIICEGKHLDSPAKRLETLEKTLHERRAALEQIGKSEQEVHFTTKAELSKHVETALRTLMATSFEFADTMRKFFPVFRIELVQARDSTLIRPRGQFLFVNPDSNNKTTVLDHAETSIEFSLDLFIPPAHIRAIHDCLQAIEEAKAHGRKTSLRKIAQQIGINYMTVKRALSYARRMEEANTSDPYQVIRERPTKAARWK